MNRSFIAASWSYILFAMLFLVSYVDELVRMFLSADSLAGMEMLMFGRYLQICLTIFR